ncbi:chemotaxis protein CheW [Dactylosporangium sp. NPDC049742]|uniref:chemotaxis protein CheW n=1 Tax=Dactylosporangium sp. NPDC049742 TaxID=3154737 RepID=UPI00342D7A20
MSVEAAPRGGGPGDSTAGDAKRYLTFTLNGESYALDIFHITEILEYRNLTVVPMTPDFVRGVINLRGRAVPVIDLAIRFAKGATSIARRTSIIIVHIRGMPGSGDAGTGTVAGDGRDGQDIGVLVDAVSKVESFTAEDIEPAPAFGAGIRADFIGGMAKRDNDFIIVLDIDHVLSLSDMADLVTALPAGAEGNGGADRAIRSS